MKILLWLLIFLISSQVLNFMIPSMALAKAKTATVDSTPLDILAMPEDARLVIAMSKKNELAQPLREIAFSEKYKMADRWKALTLLTHIDREKAFPLLEKALVSKEWYMRNAGLVGIEHLNPLEAKKAARKLLKDKALVVRSAAIQVLAKDFVTSDRGLLWEQLYDKKNFRKGQSLWIRSQVLAVLALEPGSLELPLFLQYVNEKDQSVQTASVVALERITKKKMSVDAWQKFAVE